MTAAIVPILAAPHFDPGTGRVEIEAPAGRTIAEHLAMALPFATLADLQQARVALVTESGSEIIDRRYWHRVRPRPGVRVVIRIIAGKNALRSVLAIVITIAAIATGQAWGLQFGQMLGLSGAAAGTIGTALLTAGVNIIGNLLLNALVPPVKPESPEAQRNRYSISGWRNRLEPDGAVPVILGRMRYAPPFAVLSHSEIVGDDQYVRAVFTAGEGPLDISDIRIGETPITEYDEVEVEIREGRASDAPQTIIPRQIAEESIGVELTRPLPRDDRGEVIDNQPSIETPVVRTTGADARGASIILAFPAGMIRFDDDGDQKHEEVSVRIEQRPANGETWDDVTTLRIRAKKLEGFYRQHSWNFPTRGRWQVRLTMMTEETTDSKVQRRTSWAALQTLRPEYPLNYRRPLALIAMRVKATHQLSGSLDNVNAIFARHCLDYDRNSGTWVERLTSNPASLYRYALQSPANPRAVSDASIDLEQLEDWHEFCRIHDLKYDRALDQAGSTLQEVLIEIAAAGRASPRHDGMRWGVVVDRPQELIVDHIGPRNSWAFSSRRSYTTPPHAFRVAFLDATNDWKPAERLVRWPGYAGEITLTEALELPGKTDPAEVWRETRRRMYEAIYRSDTYQVTQDGPARVATRGDGVTLSHYILDKVQLSARVRAVVGTLVELDEQILMEAGRSYGIRFRVVANAEDTIGTSVVRNVVTNPGETNLLTLVGAEDDVPEPGDLVYFGTAAEESFPMVVTGIEAAEDMASIVHMVDAAPIIDEKLASDVIPGWSGRVGTEIDDNLLQPAAPRFVSIVSGVSGTGFGNRVEYLIEPGSSPISVTEYRIEHRLAGSASWTSVTIPAANGGGAITSYGHGDAIELRAVAISPADVEGPYSGIVPLTIGADDAAIPAALDAEAVTVTTLLGGALVQFATGNDANLAQVQLYRSQSTTLNRETDAAGQPVTVSSRQSYSVTAGDTTRSNRFSANNWTADDGWTLNGDSATHTPGTDDTISHPLNTQPDRWYRIGVSVSGRSTGTVTPRLTGGTVRAGSPLDADGDYSDRIQAATGNNQFELLASSDFDGTVSGIVAYLETAACLDSGTHFLWLEPQNTDGVPGPVTGPLTIEVI